LKEEKICYKIVYKGYRQESRWKVRIYVCEKAGLVGTRINQYTKFDVIWRNLFWQIRKKS